MSTPRNPELIARQRAAVAPANSRERFVRLLALAALSLSSRPALSSSDDVYGGIRSHQPGEESTGPIPGEPVRVPARRAATKSIPR